MFHEVLPDFGVELEELVLEGNPQGFLSIAVGLHLGKWSGDLAATLALNASGVPPAPRQWAN